MDTALSLILLDSEILKIPKVKAHFLKKLAFVTNKCLTQDAFGKCPRITKKLSKYTQYANSYVHKFSYYPKYSTKLS